MKFLRSWNASARKSASTPRDPAKVAGDWVLSQAFGKEDASALDDEALVASLEDWLKGERQAHAVIKTITHEEIEADLELARDFQVAYLDRPYPKVPQTHVEGRLRLEFYHRYQAALVLGGDFFDLIPLAPDAVGVFVADVMGHGARSAMITAILRTLLRDLRSQGRNARHYVTEVNRQLCDIMESFPQPLFASSFYFVPDTTARVATFTTAGHPAPFYVSRSRGELGRLHVPPPHGAALGVIPDERYSASSVRLSDRDSFIFFTDGTYEAANAAGEEFGMSRMQKVIRQNIYKSDQEIVDGLIDAIQEFRGDKPLEDDICIVAVGVKTESEKTGAS